MEPKFKVLFAMTPLLKDETSIFYMPKLLAHIQKELDSHVSEFDCVFDEQDYEKLDQSKKY